jgi:hypothetical protein
MGIQVNKTVKWLVSVCMLALMAGCNFPGAPAGDGPGPAQPTAASAPSPSPLPPTRPAATATSVEAEAPFDGAQDAPREAILILEPGPGSRLTSPLRVAGVADPTFEQALGVRLVLADGTLLAEQGVIIEAELGQRGPFEGQIEFEVEGERNALVQVFSDSARDGGITHLASLGVVLSEEGPPSVTAGERHLERIVIEQPEAGAAVSGGVVHVQGVGVASFEGTLVVRVLDESGAEVGSKPLIVDAPEMGMPGTFSVDVPYTVADSGPGRVMVVDPLPAFDGLGHIASVEVKLKP